jgi:hypothetical protein
MSSRNTDNHLPSDMTSQPRTETQNLKSQNDKTWHVGQSMYQIIAVLCLYEVTNLASGNVYTTVSFTMGNLD